MAIESPGKLADEDVKEIVCVCNRNGRRIAV